MFYSNSMDLKDIKYKSINYSNFCKGVNTSYDESLLPISYSKNTYNFSYKDGVLTDGLGINIPTFRYSTTDSNLKKSLTAPDGGSIVSVWLYNFWDNNAESYITMLIAYSLNKKMYYNYLRIDDSTLHEITGLEFSSIPNVVNYKLNGVDTLLIVSEKEGMYTWHYNSLPVKISNTPKISSMCIHNERLFVTTYGESRSIWFSDDLNPTNFNVDLNDGGFIEIVDDFGSSNKVLSFENYLYVFRDFNIARITAFAEQTNFSVVQLYMSNARIMPKSICICGDRIMYLASDGVYAFNGSNATKLNLGIDKMFDNVDNQYAVAGYSNGYYYLACRLNFCDNEKIGCENDGVLMHNNALLKINTSTGEMSIMRGYDISHIYPIYDVLESSLLVTVRYQGGRVIGKVDESGVFFGESTPKVWISPKSNFGYPDNYKYIKEIILETQSDCLLEIDYDNKKKTILVKGGSKIKKIKPFIKAKKIAINFKSYTSGVKIVSPVVVVGIL